ncbi:GNAT family N-acetyltransferase [Radiobacillus sp. PE A8.2]|uniref:GNAT family N-acetyltransferase n=1 Tax=Radiobacillus sp. PE A8.2 TaxID=3380349 RepID=UPI00388F1217
MSDIQLGTEVDASYIKKKLIEYNMTQIPDHIKTPNEQVVLVIKDHQKIIAGVTGTMFWYHLHIDFLWVDDRVRKQGYGSSLLNEIEILARNKGCRLIFLDTFSFQAPEFYKKHGFKVVGKLEDHPQGFEQYFLEKRLTN